jgi:hypothetical protein
MQPYAAALSRGADCKLLRQDGERSSTKHVMLNQQVTATRAKLYVAKKTQFVDE